MSEDWRHNLANHINQENEATDQWVTALNRYLNRDISGAWPEPTRIEIEDVYNVTGWQTKDSGERHVTDTGYQRDTQKGKPRADFFLPPDVAYEDQLLVRIGALLARGSEKYGDWNWLKSGTQEDLERFKASAFRHFLQWFCGELDEDHAAAVAYNIMAAERIRSRGATEEDTS